jgi:hypothetical protein
VDKTDIELAGAVAKGSAEGVTAGLLKSFHELLELIAGPACEEIGQHFRDRVRLYRLRNSVRLLETLRDLQARLGMAAGEVHPKLLFPILEHASLEDDPTLSRLWAGLLASASVGRTLPAYIDIVKQLAPDDAKLLRSLYSASFATAAAEREFDAQTLLPVHVRNLFVRDVMALPVDSPDTPELWERLPMTCQNLLRVRLLIDMPDGAVRLGILGYRFMQACEVHPFVMV